MAELPDPAHRIAAEQKRWLRNLFGELATSAACSEPSRLATRLLLLHEGTLATLPLLLNTFTESIDLARWLVRTSRRNPYARMNPAGARSLTDLALEASPPW